jgi:hypothetical protein
MSLPSPPRSPQLPWPVKIARMAGSSWRAASSIGSQRFRPHEIARPERGSSRPGPDQRVLQHSCFRYTGPIVGVEGDPLTVNLKEYDIDPKVPYLPLAAPK